LLGDKTGIGSLNTDVPFVPQMFSFVENHGEQPANRDLTGKAADITKTFCLELYCLYTSL